MSEKLDGLHRQLQDEQRTLNALMAQCEGRSGADLAPYTTTIKTRRGVIRDIEHAIAELEECNNRTEKEPSMVAIAEPIETPATLDKEFRAALEREAAHNRRLEQTRRRDPGRRESKIGELDVQYTKACRAAANGEDVDLLAIDDAIRAQKAKLNGLHQIQAELREGATPLIAARMRAWAVWKRAENAVNSSGCAKPKEQRFSSGTPQRLTSIEPCRVTRKR